MKLLLLYEHPVAGATWIGPCHSPVLRISDYYIHGSSHEIHRFPLLNKIGSAIHANSGRKIRFQKPQQNLNLPKGLNEF